MGGAGGSINGGCEGVLIGVEGMLMGEGCVSVSVISNGLLVKSGKGGGDGGGVGGWFRWREEGWSEEEAAPVWGGYSITKGTGIDGELLVGPVGGAAGGQGGGKCGGCAQEGEKGGAVELMRS